MKMPRLLLGLTLAGLLVCGCASLNQRRTKIITGLTVGDSFEMLNNGTMTITAIQGNNIHLVDSLNRSAQIQIMREPEWRKHMGNYTSFGNETIEITAIDRETNTIDIKLSASNKRGWNVLNF